MNNLDVNQLPTTRYQGSKRKLLPWIYKNISSLQFTSALDIFAGTGSVSYLFKLMGKRVTFNDYLKFNYFTGMALIENDTVLIDEKDIKYLLSTHKTINYSTFVQDTFPGIFYTDEENKWIDRFLSNWNNFSNRYPVNIAQYKKAIAFYVFAQCALKKRPFNLFHRANLYLRLRKVKRTFGNKTSWEGQFDQYFKCFANKANEAVFSNGQHNCALNFRASSSPIDEHHDLIYIDPPYVRKEAEGSDVDYLNFYHFLEGACNVENWESLIDITTKNLRIRDSLPNEWIRAKSNRNAFEELFEKYHNSIIVVSYKEPGLPSKREILYSLKKFKNKVISVPGLEYNYALNKNNGFHKEYLLIGVDL